MDFLANNYQTILLVLGAVYPPVLFLLPPQVASKIDLGVKIVKVVADTLEKAKDSKGGFSSETPTYPIKTYTQKSKI